MYYFVNVAKNTAHTNHIKENTKNQFFVLVPGRVEPARVLPHRFLRPTSTNSATRALELQK